MNTGPKLNNPHIDWSDSSAMKEAAYLIEHFRDTLPFLDMFSLRFLVFVQPTFSALVKL